MQPDSAELIYSGVEEGNTETSGAVDASVGESRAERARRYRQVYKARQKEKETLAQQKLADTQRELEELRSENASLVTQTNALSLLTSYSNSMVDALNMAAVASAAKARSIGNQAIEKINSFRVWFLLTPTIPELLAGINYTPTDAQLGWILKLKSPKEFFSQHMAFIDRIALILEEGKKSPEAQKHAELKINYLFSTWLRLATIMHKENPQSLEEMVCTYQLKALREQAAAGKYVRPRILENSPNQLLRCVELNYEQRVKLEEHWKEFVEDIQAARSILGTYTSKAEASTEVTMEAGEYNPSSRKSAAESFLLVMDAASASDEFLQREGQAFIKLYIAALQVLTPMQGALVLTSCRPLVAHLPDICNMLLHGSSDSLLTIENKTFAITGAKKWGWG